jgi:hypothetical protein
MQNWMFNGGNITYLLMDVVKGLEYMTSNPVTSLAWVRSPGDTLVVKRGGR